jgi:hypothetical protein
VRREGERDYSLSIPSFSPTLHRGRSCMVAWRDPVQFFQLHCVLHCHYLEPLTAPPSPAPTCNPSTAYSIPICIPSTLLDYCINYCIPILLILSSSLLNAPASILITFPPPPLLVLLLLLGLCVPRGGERPLRPQSLSRAISLSLISFTGNCCLDSAGMTHLSPVWQRCTSLEELYLC